MPAKHSVKQYLANGHYHIYNRGVEKRKIFQDKQDYAVFLSYIKTYLQPKDIDSLRNKLGNPEINWQEKSQIIKILNLNNFHGEIQLLAYCLMSNHFHFLVKQKSANSIDNFMQSLTTRFVLYFNKKNKRIGPLFQGIYKAVLVDTDEQLLHLSRYIHINPKHISSRLNLEDCYSSYADYIGKRETDWIKTDLILSYFSKTNPKLTYSAFVEKSKTGENELIAKHILE